MEIEEGIYQIADERQMRNGLPGPNAFLVKGRQAAAFLDVGYGDAEQHRIRLGYLGSLPVPLTHVIALHRHPDHAGGAGLMAEATGAAICCHEEDRHGVNQAMEGHGMVDRVLDDGDEILLGGLTLQVLHAPGHTDGCLAVYVPERRSLFASDTVMQVSTTAIGDHGNLVKYIETLRRLATLDISTIHCGHGPAVTEPQRRLHDLIEHRAERESQLLGLLGTGRFTVRQLRERIYPGFDTGRRQQMAEGMIRSGLRKLIEEDRAREVLPGTFSVR